MRRAPQIFKVAAKEEPGGAIMRGLNGHETERPRTGSAQLGGNIVADRKIFSTKDVYHSIQEKINCGK